MIARRDLFSGYLDREIGGLNPPKAYIDSDM
jgi:hypothetical protein